MTHKRKPRQASPEPTQRERAVLALLSIGESQPAIAKALGIATTTVWQHVHSLKKRLGLNNLVQVGMWAERNGYGKSPVAPQDQCSCQNAQCYGSCD